MPVSSIAQILLRLFALHWMFVGGIQIAGMIILSDVYLGLFYPMIPSSFYIVGGVLCWFFAPVISRMLARGNDERLSLEGVTERQLFSVSFLSLGLYFALSSFADVFSWSHFFIISQSPEYGFHHEEAPSYYELLDAVLTLVAGMSLIFTARIWAAKLTKVSQGKGDGAPKIS